MKKYDMMIVGPATRDENIDYTGAVDRRVGGAVTFCTPAALAAGAKVFAAVKAAPEDAVSASSGRETALAPSAEGILDCLRINPEDAVILPSKKTTLMVNRYFTKDRERREGRCEAQSDPVLPCEIPNIEYTLAHLAGLLYGDFPNELIEFLKTKGKLAADVQGFLRHNEGGKLVFHDWKDKLRYLPYMDFLKTDAAEAEILTGLTDREAAARQLIDWGAGEVFISHNAEMLVFDGHEMRTCPVKARNLSGRTGRGDTVFAAYLAMRVTGADIAQSLLYATACVSLKMETPGSFSGNREDVYDYIRRFYA